VFQFGGNGILISVGSVIRLVINDNSIVVQVGWLEACRPPINTLNGSWLFPSTAILYPTVLSPSELRVLATLSFKLTRVTPSLQRAAGQVGEGKGVRTVRRPVNGSRFAPSCSPLSLCALFPFNAPSPTCAFTPYQRLSVEAGDHRTFGTENNATAANTCAMKP